MCPMSKSCFLALILFVILPIKGNLFSPAFEIWPIIYFLVSNIICKERKYNFSKAFLTKLNVFFQRGLFLDEKCSNFFSSYLMPHHFLKTYSARFTCVAFLSHLLYFLRATYIFLWKQYIWNVYICLSIKSIKVVSFFLHLNLEVNKITEEKQKFDNSIE